MNKWEFVFAIVTIMFLLIVISFFFVEVSTIIAKAPALRGIFFSVLHGAFDILLFIIICIFLLLIILLIVELLTKK